MFSAVCSKCLFYYFGGNDRTHSKGKSKYCDAEVSKLGLNNHHFSLRTLYYKQKKHMAIFKYSSNVLLIQFPEDCLR